MTEEYTPPYTSTPLAPGAPVVGSTPPVLDYASTSATGSTGSTADDGSTVEVAKGQAAEVTQGAVQAGQHVAGVAKDQAANVGAEAGRQAKDLLSQTGSELSQQAAQGQQRLAQGIRALGDELHSMTQRSEQSGPATDLARQGAQRSHDIASWLEQREPADVLDDVKTFARQRPGTFLLLAAGVGLLAGRMTRGLKAAAGDESETQQVTGSGSYSQYGTPTQYGSGVQYGAQQGAGAQYGAQPGETGAVVLGTVEEIEVVRPYASSEDGSAGYPATGGPTTGGAL